MDPEATRYRDLRAVTRKYSPAVLLPALARISNAQAWSRNKMLAPFGLFPWHVADAARECIGYSNPHRGGPELDERYLRKLGAIAGNLRDPLLDDHETLDALGSFMIRATNQQIPFNSLNPYAELSRLFGVCGGTDSEYEQLGMQVIREQAWIDVLGMPLQDYVRCGFVIAVLAHQNQGVVNPANLDSDAYTSLGITSEQVKHVFFEHMAIELPELRNRVRARRSANEDLLQLDFNPLMATPFVEIAPDRYVAPCAHYVLNRVSVEAVGFLGRDVLGEGFAIDLGKLVERYVGRQLDLLQHDALLPELAYGPKARRQLTCDWTIAIDDITTVVEVKTASIPHPSTLTLDAYRDAIARSVGKALGTQIPKTTELVRNRDAPFADHALPDDVYGFIVTAQPLYLVNSPFFRTALPDATVPWALLSLYGLEWFVNGVLSGLSAAELTRRLTTTFDSPSEAVATMARESGVRLARNPILDQAYFRAFPGFEPIADADAASVRRR